MSKLQWDLTGERYFELGVSRGVLYPMSSNGAYPLGVAWNGLTAVNKNPSGAEPNDMWADNIKYASIRGAEQFGGTIEAFTYPDEFNECNGKKLLAPGVYAGQQRRAPFGMSFRSEIGNDVDPEVGFKLHVIYGATVSPSEEAYATINESPEGATLSFEMTTTPVEISKPGFRPTAVLEIDSRTVDPDRMEELLEILHGSTSANARLPLPDELLSLLEGDAVVPTAPTFVASTGVLTIPTVAGVEYKVNGVTAAAGAKPPAPGGTLLQVTAHSLSGYSIAPETPRTWAFVSTLV